MSRFSVIKAKGKFYVVAKDTNTLAGGPFLSPEEAGQRSDALNVLDAAQAVELKKRQAAADANQMSRFRAYKSGGKFYVKTTDSNGLAGGPYDTFEQAEQRAANLAALEAKHAAILAERTKNEHRMNITKGYRSPDVEDGRFDEPPFSAASAAIVERIFPGQVKWNTHDKKPPVDGWEPGWKKHHIPIEDDPVYAPPDAVPYVDDPGAGGPLTPLTPAPLWKIHQDHRELRNPSLRVPSNEDDPRPDQVELAKRQVEARRKADQAELAKRQAAPPKGIL